VSRARSAARVRVITVNRAWERLDKVDALYAADPEWWDTYYVKVGNAPHVVDEKYTADKDTASKYGLVKMRAKANPGINFDYSSSILTGTNSGQQAINLAVLHGAKQIILLGFDMRAGWHRNWHDAYPLTSMNRAHHYSRWISEMEVAAADLKAHCIDVVNCSNPTALTCFRCDTIEGALAS